MQYSEQRQSNLDRVLKVEVPAQTIADKTFCKASDMAKTASIAGFRPGKVPPQVIKQRYQAKLQQEVLSEIVEGCVKNIFAKEKIEPVTRPQIAIHDYLEGKPLIFEVTYALMPVIELKPMASFTFDQIEATISEEDIDRAIKIERQALAVWTPVARAAKLDDRITFDFQGTIEGKAFEGGSSQAQQGILGSGMWLPGLEEALLGSCAGDKKEVSVVFPKEYPSHLAGKNALLDIEVKQVEEAQLPEIDDAFAVKLNISGVDKLRSTLEERMQFKLRQHIYQLTWDHVLDKLVAAHPFELPNLLIELELTHLKQSHRDESEETLLSRAHHKVAKTLLARTYMTVHHITLDKEVLASYVKGWAMECAEPVQFMQWLYSDQARLREAEAVALREQAVVHMMSKANKNLRKLSYTEVMNWSW